MVLTSSGLRSASVGAVRVSGFDHLVLRVADVERSLAWYLDVLGLAPVRVEDWRRGRAPFPSARIDASTIIDFVPRGREPAPAPAGRATRDLDHLCLVVDPCDLAAAAATAGLAVVDGPGPRFGAQGTGTSLYVLDPDGNTVELRHYG